MPDPERLLELIEDGIVAHGGDLGGWTRREGETFQLFDGRVTLTARVEGDESGDRPGLVHCHVFACLHDYDDETLDACVFGFGNDEDAGLREASVVWITAVAGPIRSFLDNTPVCMTCQAGVTDGDKSRGYVEGDYGLPSLRAYVGPAIMRGFSDDKVQADFDEHKPWFRHAAESAAPQRVHLVKTSIIHRGDEGWCREMEIDGHDVAHSDPDWPTAVRPEQPGYLTRFAVFEFPPNSDQIARRAELERTIRHFAAHYKDFEGSETIDPLLESMEQQGFDPDLVHDAEAFATIAFSRCFFEPMGAKFAPTVIRALRDGRVVPDVPLISVPAFSRAKAIAAKLARTMPPEEFQGLCFYNAEAQAILKAYESSQGQLDLTKISFYPCVVPDRGVSQATMDAALALLQGRMEEARKARAAKTPPPPPKKPWWRFW